MTIQLRGVLCMLGAVATFSLMDMGLKFLSMHYAPAQVAALRGLASWPLILCWALLSGGVGQLIRVRWSLHLLRGVLAVVMLAAFAYALQSLPLAEAYALFFVAPLMITALSVPILGEQVGWRRWSAIGVGLIGTVVILRPSGRGMLSLSGLAMIAAAFAYSVSAISVRALGRTDTTQAMVFWMLTLLSLFATAVAWPQWQPILRQDWWLLLGVGVSGAIGQYCVTEAFRETSASVVAPLEYTALVWALGLDWLFFRTLPDAMMLLGAGIIVLSGLYLISRESALKAK
ncbi:EamA domain-containing membrane protein RarD [Tahibacter aquaticus]|uniref:EamA domain-containing membrane protein RarD n=1 Tax=Tahibacter aquaticus TaxID=520092 RepID=A0A4R6YQD3_9GAMM|nr:DMT family transporter [Tahibacter aquaticus]TDR40073.1 EamA domain-containing membrane protein RarD [Tahibacter aquaticus]